MNFAKRIERINGKLNRIYNKINGPTSRRGSDSGVFLPQWRMRQIRWEQSVVNRRLKEEGMIPVESIRIDCSCGSIACLGNISHIKKKKVK